MVRYKKDTTRPGLIRVPKDESLPLKFWQATVELPGIGRQRRRVIKRSKDWQVASDLLTELEKTRAENPQMATRSLTVEAWMDLYFRTIASKKQRPKTLNNARGLIRNHVIPVIGHVKVDQLTPAGLRAVTDTILDRGLSSTTARQVHFILSGALAYAIREGLLIRNVAKLMDVPPLNVTDLKALTAEQAVHLVLDARASGDRLWALWAAALFTGARQGELLGLEINRVSSHLDLSWQLQRITWQHGCNPFCGRKRGTDCRQRTLNAPADWAHRPTIGGLWLAGPKSKAGIRVIPLVEPLLSIINEHIAETAGEPNQFDLVWRTPNGAPIDPRVESEAWHAALEHAKLPDVRLHDARHTTIDLLYEAGVPEDVITEIVGHSSWAVTRGYKSKTRQVRKIAAMQQLSNLIAFPDRQAIEG